MVGSSYRDSTVFPQRSVVVAIDPHFRNVDR